MYSNVFIEGKEVEIQIKGQRDRKREVPMNLIFKRDQLSQQSMLKNNGHILLSLSDPMKRGKYHYMEVLGVSSFISDFPPESPITACKALSTVPGSQEVINICKVVVAAAIARMTCRMHSFS